MVVNAAQLATYSQAKQVILGTGYVKDGIPCHFYASMISGLVSCVDIMLGIYMGSRAYFPPPQVTTAASMPVDIVKTKIQNMRIIDGKPEFNGIMDVLGRVIKGEGFFSLWKGGFSRSFVPISLTDRLSSGFTPYYMRLGPHTVITFVILEQANMAHPNNESISSLLIDEQTLLHTYPRRQRWPWCTVKTTRCRSYGSQKEALILSCAVCYALGC